MTCTVCARPRPLNLWATGIWFDAKEIPSAVAYKCVCGNNRHILWAEASREQRQQAHLAQHSVDAAYSEMMCH